LRNDQRRSSQQTDTRVGNVTTEAHHRGASVLVNDPTKPVAVVENSHVVGSAACLWLFPLPHENPLWPNKPQLIEVGCKTIRQALSSWGSGCHEDALRHIVQNKKTNVLLLHISMSHA